MKKKLIFSLFYLLFISLNYLGCKKQEIIKSNSKPLIDQIALTIPMADSLEIFRQIKWIARGLPGMANNNASFKAEVENIIKSNSPEFIASNRVTQNNCTGFINYRNTLSNRINTDFGANDYDSSIFFEIEYDNCKLSVGIMCPDIDVVNKSLPHLIVPTDPCDIVELPYYGYYINLGKLDSILLEDNDIEDYYIWWVVAEDDCSVLAKRGVTENCGNGQCEPWLGEKFGSCVDCKKPPISGQNLMVIGVIT